MAEFSVQVVRIRDIEPIPNADAIELAVVGDYRSIVKKGLFAANDLAVYLPEQAMIPPAVLEEIGLVGKLSGPGRNVVKAIKLRGCLSQGIVFRPANLNLVEDADVAADLGIEKYEPTIPAHFAASQKDLGLLHGQLQKYDLENFKRHPWLIQDGEEVEFTEKLHGTLCGIAVLPGTDAPDLLYGDVAVFSKGLGARGFAFKDVPENDVNVYLSTVKTLGLAHRIKSLLPDEFVTVFGEIYGAGVQDLTYGTKQKTFAAFDVYLGRAGQGRFLDRDELSGFLADAGIARVPVLYRGPFSREVLAAYTDGKTVAGDGAHIREGVVVTPVAERDDTRHGRVALKSVSGDYLTRKGETTEFQ